jgi:hypothetical protein
MEGILLTARTACAIMTYRKHRLGRLYRKHRLSPPATPLLIDLIEARPLIRTELTVKTPDGGHQIYGLVDCAATLDFVFEDFVRRFALQTRKSLTKTHVRLASGQRVTSSTVCDVTFELARHEFQRTLYVLRDLCAADLILGLPWLDDEHASLQFGSTMVFTLNLWTALKWRLSWRNDVVSVYLCRLPKFRNVYARRAAAGDVTLNYT